MARSFTVKSQQGLLSSLGTPCHVSKDYDPLKKESEYQFHANWDTGSSTSVITQRVVDACGLKPLRNGFTQGVHGIKESQSYVVNLYLPRKIAIRELTVVRANPGNVWWDVLIGMDIISAGTFTVVNVNSNIEWTFSISAGEDK